MNHTKRTSLTTFALLAWILGALARSASAEASLTVDVDQPGHAISPTLWGIFFEDINLSADGGLYPELVRNRSFEDSTKPSFWTFSSPDGGAATIETRAPLNSFNPHYLRIRDRGGFILENGGYWGMNIVSGEAYQLKLAARIEDEFSAPLTVKLLSSAGTELASGQISGLTRNWKYYSLALPAQGGDSNARLQITSSGPGGLCLDMVSLMP